MHPCPPWAETRVFSGHRASRGARSEALRRSSADSDGPVGGAILLHHDSRRDRGDGASGPARCTFRTFRSAHESRARRTAEGGGGGIVNRAHRSSRATWILFMMHDLHCRYPATRINHYRICAMNFYIAADNISDRKYRWHKRLKDVEKIYHFACEKCFTFYCRDIDFLYSFKIYKR